MSDDFAHRARAAAPLNEAVNRARALLDQALELIDDAGVPGHIGARLQHVIDEMDVLARH